MVIDCFVSGALWSGQSLAAFALPLSIAPADKRPFYVGTFNAAQGLTFAAASMAGGAIAHVLPNKLTVGSGTLFGLQVLFIASSVMRLASALLTVRLVEGGSRSVDALFRMAAESSSRLAVKLVRLPVALLGR